MGHELLDSVEKQYLKPQPPELGIGDTVDVHTRIIEGEKERTQVFNGVVIARRGHGINASFKVRRIVANQGVERTFLLHSPRVLMVDVKRHGKVRRAKLYYLRDRVGKARRLKERRRVRTVPATTAVAESPAFEAPEPVGAGGPA